MPIKDADSMCTVSANHSERTDEFNSDNYNIQQQKIAKTKIYSIKQLEGTKGGKVESMFLLIAVFL